MKYFKIPYTISLIYNDGECVIKASNSEHAQKIFDRVAETEPEMLAPNVDKSLFEKLIVEVDDHWIEEANIDEEEYEAWGGLAFED